MMAPLDINLNDKQIQVNILFLEKKALVILKALFGCVIQESTFDLY